MPIRFIPGMGYQVRDDKGVHHSTHDTREEAEQAHEELKKPATKEHEQEYWKK